MAFEVVRMHDAIVSHSKNEPLIRATDDNMRFHISGRVDVPPSHHIPHLFPCTAAIKAGYSPSGLTPPRLWSFKSSTSSIETESNEEDDDYMAGLAEQMTHLMLDNDDEDELDFGGEALNIWSSNWLPSIPKPPSADTESYNSCWPNGGCQASHSHPSLKVPFLPKYCPSSPATVEDDSVELLRCGKVDVPAAFKKVEMDSFSTQLSRQHNSGEDMGRKIEEFLWRQALKQAAHGNVNLSRDSSHVPCESKAKPSYGSRAHRSSKVREDERKTHNNQGRYRRHVTQPTTPWARHSSRPQQQSNVAPINTPSARITDPRCARVLDPAASSWKAAPNLNNGLNMRAVFLSANGNGRESAGTGVFLPRCTGIVNETKRKSVCSTVLLPSRIVQVLNLHVDDLHPQQHFPPVYASSYESGLASAGAAGSIEYYSHQDYVKPYPSSHLHQPSEAEINLPIEWTY